MLFATPLLLAGGQSVAVADPVGSGAHRHHAALGPATTWKDRPGVHRGRLERSGASLPRRQPAATGRLARPAARPKAAPAGATYYAPTTPQRMIPGQQYTVPFTLTNTTAATWAKKDYVLSYHWTLPDGTDRSTSANQLRTALPADLASGASVDLDAQVKAPEPGLFGNARQAYVLRWDLLNRTTGKWLSQSAGVPTLDQDVAVEDPTSDRLGLENFYQYSAEPAGSGGSVLVNAANGNAVFDDNILSDPGRGLATFVRLTYNSLDTSDSFTGPGWSVSASTLTRLGSPLQFGFGLSDLEGYPATVTLVDGDGTSHVFPLDKHGSHDPADWDYDKPAGVHLYLQRTGSKDPDRVWVMTRPDRTQFFFDEDGNQTATMDGNGNTVTFHYTRSIIGNRNTGVLTSVTDATGRQALTLDYYQHGQDFAYFTGDVKHTASGLANPAIVDQLRSVTDLSGRRITFTYSDNGLLQEVADGAGTPQEKDLDFFYDGGTLLSDPKLVRVTDPLGHSTRIAYHPDSDGELREHRAAAVTDRAGGVTGFDYAAADGTGGGVRETVTDANGHASAFTVDGYGRPVSLTDARNATTQLAWDADNNVRRLQEANGAVTTWSYDQNTGYPLQITDAVQSAGGGASTGLSYRTFLNGHVADLIEKVSPEGRTWTFGRDAAGNLTSVTDPAGNAPGAQPGHFTSRYTYDAAGELVTSTDADGNVTGYADYDPTGFPKTITDALGGASRYVYDPVGDVVSVTDAKQATSTYTYDIFKRPLATRVPKDVATGAYITTPGPVYDKNDNVVRVTAANGSVSTSSYDADDRIVASSAPRDTPTGPDRITTYTYDAVGNELSETAPNGTLTRGDPNDFTSRYTYDEVNQLTVSTDALGGRTTYSYDAVGNTTMVVDPVKNATPDPSDYTAKYGYDRDHRGTTVTDAAGHTKSTSYDADGLQTATTDEDGNRTLDTLDARGDVAETKVPHQQQDGTITYRTTRYAYDEVGNRTKVITPRGVESGVDGAFVQETRYDPLNRVKAQLTPFDPGDSRYNAPAETDYSYDPVGQVVKVSAPPSQDQTVRNDTTYNYFDNGWVRSSTDPWNIVTSYDYNVQGQQTARTISSAGGSMSRTMSWDYYPDGKVKSRKDNGLPAGTAVELVDNSDAQNVSAVGEWPASSGGSGFEGYDYQTHPAGGGSDSFTWNLTLPLDGTYEVFARYPAVNGAATDASYTVTAHGATATRTVDQTQHAGDWVSLGSYTFAADDTAQKVTLAANAGGAVTADAVKLVRATGAAAAADATIDFGYTYDADGSMTDLADHSTGARFDDYAATDDGLDRITRLEVGKGGAVRHTTGWTYDADGNTLTRADDAATATFGYDTRNLLASVTNAESASDPKPKTTTFDYAATGLVSKETRANGNSVTSEYFLDGLLQHQVEKKSDGTLVSEHTLSYDPDGNKSKDVEKTQNADNHGSYLDRTTDYSYDPRDRLAKATKSDGGAESYVHDANDNVISETVGGTTTTSKYNRNRLQTTTAGGFTSTYNYDPFGRLDTVSLGGNVVERYTYDGFDHIASEKKKVGQAFAATDYTYDPFDRTVAQTTDAGGSKAKTTTFDYLGLSNAVVAEAVDGKVTKTYQYSPWGERLSQVLHKDDGSEEPTYYSYNPHSDVQAVTDGNGDTKATYGYTAYGADDSGQDTGVDKGSTTDPGQEPYNAYRFNAARFDGATGNYNMGFRTYDPGLNSFLTRDLYNGALSDLGLATDPFTGNRYAFAGGNPLSNIEINGHNWLSDLGHAALDVAGMIPVVGAVADVANGAWYAAEGDYLDAGLSFAGAIPVIGDAALSSKYAIKGAKYATEAVEGVDEAVQGAKDVEHAVQDVKAADRAASDAADAQKAADQAAAAQKAAEEAAAAKKAAEEAAAARRAAEARAEAAAEARAEAKAEAEAESKAETKAEESSSCRPNSFPAGTRVLLGDGTRKPIDEVRPGDTVESTDPTTGRTRSEAVTDRIVTPTDTDFTDTTVRTAGGDRTITSTQHHRFWDASRAAWVDAAGLRAGDRLREPDGTLATIVAVRNYQRHVTTYNLTVTDQHTYFVVADGGAWLGSGVTGDAAVLVHNANEGDVCRLTLGPDGNSRAEGVAATHGDRVLPHEQDMVNEFGDRNGCWSCGAKESGYADGHWTGDHNPANALAPNGPWTLYPQCKVCSRQQGGIVRTIKQGFYQFTAIIGRVGR
ncbi:MAG: polymorphic toxin-type HINT domain-containing protein [Mycobacteriales bacterium]